MTENKGNDAKRSSNKKSTGWSLESEFKTVLIVIAALVGIAFYVHFAGVPFAVSNAGSPAQHHVVSFAEASSSQQPAAT